jgi:hypothetical protein
MTTAKEPLTRSRRDARGGSISFEVPAGIAEAVLVAKIKNKE